MSYKFTITVTKSETGKIKNKGEPKHKSENLSLEHFTCKLVLLLLIQPTNSGNISSGCRIID